jgi:SAM-dependent methyltransferase
MIDDHPLEECPFASGYFDLVVMINVLDHVRDALLCLEQVKRVVAPGGLVVLGQDLVSADALDYVDPLHPIRILQPTMDNAVADDFEPLLRRVLPREESRNPDVASGTWLFIVAKDCDGERPWRRTFVAIGRS